MDVSAWLRFLAPYQFSSLTLFSALLALALYLRGLHEARRRGVRVSRVRRTGFLVGLALCYAVLHTRIDYYAQYVFFIHRLQHLVLHHAGPFLIALSVPWSILGLGVPERLRERWLRPLLGHPAVQVPYRVVQNPVVAPLLFVGLIYLWLTPDIHFAAMLDLRLYHLMNWSMLIDGLLFWWLMLNPRPTGSSAVMSFAPRILVLFLVMLPQIVLGAYIALSEGSLYNFYDVCGQPWPISPTTDRQLGGLFTWIPAAMMSVVGILFVIVFMMRADQECDARRQDAELPDPEASQ